MNHRFASNGIAAVFTGLVLAFGCACDSSRVDELTWSTVYAEGNTHRGITRSVAFSVPEGPVRVRVQVAGASAQEVGSDYRLVNVDPAPGASRVVRLIATSGPTPGQPGIWRGELHSEGSVPAGKYRLVYRSQSSGPMEVEVLVGGTAE